MDTVLLMLLYWGIFFLFYFIACRFCAGTKAGAYLDKGMTAMIALLVFLMGLQMGANEEVTSNLAEIGVQAALITAMVLAGSIGSVWILRRILKLDKEGMEKSGREEKFLCPAGQEDKEGEEILKPEDAAEKQNLSMTGFVLLFVVAGMGLGHFVIAEKCSDLDAFRETTGNILVAGLCLLLAMVGFHLGLTGGIIETFKSAGFRIILFPAAAVFGSLLGGIVYGMVSSLTVKEGIAVSAGFGWYTLAPSMIIEAGYVVAGAVSFLHNVMREVFGIVMIPFIAKKLGYLEAVATPGVAAMDICIPIVKKSCRPETVAYSFATGLLMCIMVPVAVPLAVG